MFLRRYRREVNGETYEYWALVESYRTEREAAAAGRGDPGQVGRPGSRGT
jgi:hypothetical protein